MTRVGICGDWHGNAVWAKSALRALRAEGIREVYQLGDFTITGNTRGNYFLEQITQACQEHKIKLYIVPGNHENYDNIEDPASDDGVIPPKQTIAEGPDWEISYLPRGWQWNVDGVQFLAFGGAPSVDAAWRTQGYDWWKEEAIRETDLLRLSSHDDVTVMLCHDAPDGGTARVQAIIEDNPQGWPDASLRYAAQGRELMNRAVQEVNPRWFFHGHYHVADHRYDSLADRHYVSMDLDGTTNNVGILSWEKPEDITFEFFGGDTWI